MPSKPNKFDPKPEPEQWEPEKAEGVLNDRAETFLLFVRRCLGTGKIAPLVVGSEPLNGASLKAIYEAFDCCYPLGKNGLPEADPLAARRAALQNGEKQTDA